MLFKEIGKNDIKSTHLYGNNCTIRTKNTITVRWLGLIERVENTSGKTELIPGERVA